MLGPGTDSVTAVVAADRLFRGGIDSGRSAFAPGVHAWTADSVSDLRRCFVDKPDES